MVRFFDVHAHIHDSAYDADRGAVLARMKEHEVAAITVGTGYETSRAAVALAEANEHIYASIGIHPTDRIEPFDIDPWESLVLSPRVVAIGECGLDYYRAREDTRQERARQKVLFETQLEFAVRNEKPLMVHCRDAHRDMIDILAAHKKTYGEKLRGNIHFFTAGLSEARAYLASGFTLSFSGVITFARDYDEVIAYTPLASILSETDSPYATPVPFRGTRNEPSYVREIASRIAAIRGEDPSMVATALVRNAERAFLRSF